MENDEVNNKQLRTRKYVLIAVAVTPLYYVLLALRILMSKEEVRIVEYRPFIVFLSVVFVSLVISTVYLTKHWVIHDQARFEKQLVQDLIRLAIIQSIPTMAFIYFIMSLSHLG